MIVVVGDGWAALGAVGFLVSSEVSVTWIKSSGSRIYPPLASLEMGPGVRLWAELAGRFGIDCSEIQQGTLIKEFRNKAFREPAWGRAPTPGDREEVRKEVLWAPEQRMMGTFEARFDLTLSEIEEGIRRQLESGGYSQLEVIEEVPLSGLKKRDDQIIGVVLGSGEVIECEKVIYADRWGLLSSIEGMPKPIPFMRKREAIGVLQAVFTHHTPVGAGVSDSFFSALHRSSGDEQERHVMGHFSSDGKRSIWSLCLSAEEVEDNHEIAKKLRRLKSTLDRVFEGTEMVSSGQGSFANTVQGEQVRFGEELIFADGMVPDQPITCPELGGVYFLTDGYGPSSALYQVGRVVEVEARQSNPETENVNLAQANS